MPIFLCYDFEKPILDQSKAVSTRTLTPIKQNIKKNKNLAQSLSILALDQKDVKANLHKKQQTSLIMLIFWKDILKKSCF